VSSTVPPEQSAPTAPAPRRSNYPGTALALIGSVIGTLGIVLFLVLVVVRPDGMTPPRVDWVVVASEANDPELLAPELPAGWTANYAERSSDGDMPIWRIGFLSPGGAFIGMNQALDTSDAWVIAQLGDAEIGPVVDIGGLRWTTIDQRAEPDAGNHAYVMIAELPGAEPRAVELYGTAPDEDFRVVAEAIARDAEAS
jgi:hypothetical protein